MWRRAAAAAVWLAGVWLVASRPALLFPPSLVLLLGRQGALMLGQLASLAFGLGAATLLVRPTAPWLGMGAVRWRPVVAALLLSPALYAAATYVAIRAALPTLMQEVALHGVEAPRRAAGEYGRMMESAPLLQTLLWAAALAAVGEELLFRGAVWSTIAAAAERIGAPARAAGVVATVVAAGAFAWMHRGLPGGIGIVQTVSALVLGLGAGAARLLTKTIWASMTLHFLHNCAAVAGARGLLASSAFPVVDGVPTLMVALGAAGVIAFGLASVARRLSSASPR